MKTKLLLAFFCFYFVNTLKAQNPFPIFSDNPQWYLIHTFSIDEPFNVFYTYGQEVNACGKTYNKVIKDFSYTQGYIRNEGKKVYFRNSTNCSDLEYLVYDFSLAVGDSFSTITYTSEGEANISFKVKTIEPYIISNGDTVSKFDMEYSILIRGSVFKSSIPFFEGIGSIQNPFYFTGCFFDGGCENLVSFICLHKNENLYASFSSQCFLGFVDVKENETSNNFSISPNPANDYFKINVENFDDFKQTYFRLLDLSGKLLWEKTFEEIENQNVSIQKLNNGLYFLQAVENGKILKAQKVLVQH